jgi:CRISPR-associated protein Csh2
MDTSTLPIQKSEILFLYESTYSVPNGDPFTGEQRYDEETKKILVSDVRIKRFIRDHFALENPSSIYVLNDASLVAEKKKKADDDAPESAAAAEAKAQSGSADRFIKLKGDLAGANAEAALKDLIDVRLFGGILTKKGAAINMTGAVQFALLNPSLNAVDLRMHQNTSVFASSTEKSRGAIGTTTVVPYALCQIHGWINPFAAQVTGLQEADVEKMFGALWDSVNNANTRSKSNQNSLLLLQIVYAQPTKKLYGLDRMIKLNTKLEGQEEKRDEQLRSRDDFELDFEKLKAAAASDKVERVRFHTEDESLAQVLGGFEKFEPMGLS